MSIKSEIAWTRRNEEGEKIQVYAHRHGGSWSFHSRLRRFDDWEPITSPSLEDWLVLLDGIRRRVPRKLYPPAELDRVRQTIRERFPEAEIPPE